MAGDTPPMKLLLVEDNAAVRRVIRSIVAALADEIVECADGADALKAYSSCSPDFVLMDIEMKRMDGIMASKLILDFDPEAKIIIVTNYDDAGLREAARDAGACGYVVKENLVELTSQSLFVVGMAAGRFRGQLEVAVLSRPSSATQGGLNLTFLSVDPKTLAITVKGPQALPVTSNKVTSVSLAAGHFNAVDHDQLAITYQQEGGLTYFFGIDFDSQGNIATKPQLQIGDYPGNVRIRRGRFDPQSPFDQVASMFWSGNPVEGFAIGILGFDDQMNVVGANKGMSDLTTQCVYDMQVGDFDHTQPNPDPNDPNKTVHNPTMQIAIATGLSSCGPDGVKVSIWNVTGNQKDGWTLTKDVSTKTVPVADNDGVTPKSIQGLSFAPVDYQGRSLVLGEPTVVTIENRSQPTVILASPPMHVDYIVPTGGSKQQILNFTAAPGGFFTSFQTSDNSDTSSSTTNSMTWSFAATETATYGYNVGDCELGDCASVDAKASAKQALDGSKSALHGTFNTTNVKFEDNTGFADIVRYTSSTLTSYIYPILGRKVCPSAKPTCSDSEKIQASVQFAGPAQ